jgi:hypothetical protein
VGISRTKGNDVGSIKPLQCHSCGQVTNHEVLSSINERGEDEGPTEGYSTWWKNRHWTLACKGCDQVSYLKESCFSEEMEHDAQGNPYYPWTREIYPKRTEREGMGDAHLLPEAVRLVYEETVAALNNRMPILAGIGIRAILESICKDRASPGGRLIERIDGLASQGYLSPEGKKTLHQIRSLGNESAHEAKPHKVSQLALALDICEHVLAEVYIIPPRVEALFAKSQAPL